MTAKFDISTISPKFFNTEKRQKEELKTLKPNEVTIYTCGPTVYNYAHIGNYRTYIFEDLLRRALKFFGWKVTQAMNLTDVDDKTIKGAIRDKVTLDEFTKPFKEAFFKDLTTLGIERVEYYPAATEYIEQMIELIQQLMDKGVAYQGADGSVYYAISKFPRYGSLSHLNLDELKAGASDRVASDEYDKDHVADFVLWKGYDPERDGNIFWESPFGPGRPGWHLECSCMAMKLLGTTIDIHVGGVDNIFPHHENEIAQSEAVTGERFVKHWMHSEHLIVDNKKMSKSLGNFYTLRDLLDKGFTGTQVRFMLLQTHYKTQLNFTFEGVEAVKQTLRRMNDFIQRLLNIRDTEDSGAVEPVLQQSLHDFAMALSDDLNISVAISAVFDLIHKMNSLCDEAKVGQGEAEQTLELMKRFDSVLGVLTFEKEQQDVPQEVQEALEKRLEARKNKDWALADELRDYIEGQGWVIVDTVVGASLKRQE